MQHEELRKEVKVSAAVLSLNQTIKQFFVRSFRLDMQRYVIAVKLIEIKSQWKNKLVESS